MRTTIAPAGCIGVTAVAAAFSVSRAWVIWNAITGELPSLWIDRRIVFEIADLNLWIYDNVYEPEGE